MALAAIGSPTPTGGVSAIRTGIASEAIAVGLSVRINANGLVEIVDTTSVDSDDQVGISVTAAAGLNSPVSYVPNGGDITTSGLTVGDVQYVSDAGTFGTLSEVNAVSGRITAGWMALSTTKLRVLGLDTGVLAP